MRGEKGEPGEFLECTSQNKMIDRVSDKLSRHIRNVPLVVREVLMGKETKEIVTNIIGKDVKEEKSVMAKEIRRLKNLNKHPLSKYSYWYSECGENNTTEGGRNLYHKHKADATYGPHPDTSPEGWVGFDSNGAHSEKRKYRMAAAERSFRAQELEREKSLKENSVT